MRNKTVRVVPLRVVAVAALATLAILASACAQPSGGGGTPPAVTQVPAHGGFQMVPNGTRGFYGMPFPNEIRKLEDGTIDMRGLPGSNNNVVAGDPVPVVPYLKQSIARAAKTITDFGRNSAIYFSGNRAMDPATFPQNAVASTLPDSTVMLVNLDTGVPHPVLSEYEETGDRFKQSRMLTILPYPGKPLAADADYAAVLFTGIKTLAGAPIQPAPLVSQLDSPYGPSHGVTEAVWTELQSQRDRVRTIVNSSTDWEESEIAAFTVFHTQDTSVEIDAIDAALAELPTPAFTVTSQAPCAVDNTAGGNGATNSLIMGTMAAPDFQVGNLPYLQSGGFFEIVDGKAVVKRTRNIPVRLRVPCGDQPVGGWPSIAHIGAQAASGNTDAFPPPFSYDGFVFGEIPAHMAGVTSNDLTTVGVPPADQPGLLYANFINPAAGRANPLQQVAYHVSLARVIENLSLDGAALGTTGTVETNPAASIASGHSQGAATLPFVANSVPGLAAVFSSSGTGGQYHSLAHTGQRESLALFTGESKPLNELNPLIQLVQTTTDASDAINVDGLPDGLHYMNVVGSNDGCVAIEGSRHFAGALGLGIANRQYPTTFYGDPAFDPIAVSMPAGGNGPGGATRLQIEGWGDHTEAATNKHLGNNFLRDVAAGATPTVQPYAHQSTYGVCGWRYDYVGEDPYGRVAP